MPPSSSSTPCSPNRCRWWMSNRKVAERHVKEARVLLSSQDVVQREAALNLLDSAVELCPRWEVPLHLKATALLRLRRYRDVADLLRDDLPYDSPLSVSSSTSSDSISRESINLLNVDSAAKVNAAEVLTRCFFFRFLAGKQAAGRATHRHHWRYIVLGQALFHLGLLEDSLLLLQAGKRLASARARGESVLFPDDVFAARDSAATEELDCVAQLIANVKSLLRRRKAALAAMDFGMPEEAIRHFSKILDGSRRGVPQAYLAECYMHRATAYQAAGRLAESIADCNRTLALEPTRVGALSTRAALLEQARCFTECLQDLGHLKLLYNSILVHNGRLAGSGWHRPGTVTGHGDAAAAAQVVAAKIAYLKQMVVTGEGTQVDYHALLGLPRGCTRSKLECTHRVLCLRHRPDRSTGFVDRCEFADDRDTDGVRDRARMSSVLLYRLLQKAYAHVMATVMEKEAAHKQKQRVAATAGSKPTAAPPVSARVVEPRKDCGNRELVHCLPRANKKEGFSVEKPVPVHLAGYCRETAGTSVLLLPGFAHPAHHLHQALSY